MRREMVASLRRAGSGADPDFDRLTQLAAATFNVPIGVVALLDDDRLWLYARYGLDIEDALAKDSLAAATVTGHDLDSLVVQDAAADPRFATGPLVAGEPRARFYAGAPVMVRGQRVGALYVMSPALRAAPSDAEMAGLLNLAALAGSLFELKDEARVRARMAADLIKEEWRHALTLEAGKVGSWVWDLRSGEIIANDIFRQMFGFAAGNSISSSEMMAAIDGDDIEAVNKALELTFEEGSDYAVEFRIGATGRWLIGRGRVYQRDGAGRPLIMMGVNIDVTDAREAAEQTRLLLRELNHRVKNTLAMIQSLARQTMRQTPDPRQFLDTFSGRLRTLSEAHGLLADHDWFGIGLVELINLQVNPYLLTSADQLELVGEDLQLPPDHALGLGLILHELASNALRYGSLSKAGGRVRISWALSRAAGRRVEFTWKESGGPPVVAPTETGFGTRLIQHSLDKVLDSSVSLSFPEAGLEAKILLPLG